MDSNPELNAFADAEAVNALPSGDAVNAFYASLLIGQARIYDVLLKIYSEMNPAEAVELRDRHTQGLIYFPPPSYAPDGSHAASPFSYNPGDTND